MAEVDGDVIKEVEHGLGRKVGPLPLWGWIAGGAGVVVAAMYLLHRGQPASAGASMLGPLSGGTGAFSGGGGGGGGGAAAAPPVATGPLTNADWLQKALGAVEQATGLNPAEATVYLEDYLGGGGPVGNSQALGQYQAAIKAAIDALGNPPQAIPGQGVNGNPYSSNATFLNSLLGFLPTGTAASVQQELVNLFAGNTTTISQAAADALAAAENVIGLPPNAIAYTIQQAAGAPPTPGGTPTPLKLPDLTTWVTNWTQSLKLIDQNAYSYFHMFNNVLNANASLKSVAASLSTAQRANVYNQIQLQTGFHPENLTSDLLQSIVSAVQQGDFGGNNAPKSIVYNGKQYAYQIGM